MKFEELFEEIMTKAKTVANAAGKVTGEVVDIGKLRYQLKQTQWDMDKTCSKLGALVYESKKSNEDYSDIITLAISEIDALTEKLNDFEDRLRSYKKAKKCGGCGKSNDVNNTFCARCGEVLEVEDEDEDGGEPFVVEIHEVVQQDDADVDE